MKTKRGFYRHYRGGIYFVLGVGRMHDDDKDIIMYVSTQGQSDGRIRLRSREEWEEAVNPVTGQPVSVGGELRFKRLANKALVDVLRGK